MDYGIILLPFYFIGQIILVLLAVIKHYYEEHTFIVTCTAVVISAILILSFGYSIRVCCDDFKRKQERKRRKENYIRENIRLEPI